MQARIFLEIGPEIAVYRCDRVNRQSGVGLGLGEVAGARASSNTVDIPRIGINGLVSYFFIKDDPNGS